MQSRRKRGAKQRRRYNMWRVFVSSVRILLDCLLLSFWLLSLFVVRRVRVSIPLVFEGISVPARMVGTRYFSLGKHKVSP